MSGTVSAWGHYLSHPGLVRHQNEDSVVIGTHAMSDLEGELAGFRLDEAHGWIVAVIDGIGGHTGGQAAADYSAKAMAAQTDFSEIEVQRALLETHAGLLELAQKNPELKKCGAAIAGIAALGTQLCIFNVGDCRVYRVQDGFLALQTCDDSLAEALRESLGDGDGAIRPPNAHALIQALGAGIAIDQLKPHTRAVTAREGSRYLICSDGLTDLVNLDAMEMAFKESSDSQTVVNRLVDQALTAGGRDNVTIIDFNIRIA
jgi:serine/threonine protein phosphatase PrpC